MTYYFPLDASYNEAVSEGNYKTFMLHQSSYRLPELLWIIYVFNVSCTFNTKTYITIVYEKYAIDMHICAFYLYTITYIILFIY